MKINRLAPAILTVGLLSAICLSACAAETSSPGSPGSPRQPAPVNLCAGPDASAYMQCPGYKPPDNLTNEWNSGGWDAGT